MARLEIALSTSQTGLYAPYAPNFAAPMVSQPYAPRPFLPPSASWKTTGSVDVEVNVGDLRPEATFQTDDGHAVLLICGEVPEYISGMWTATARDYNEIFSGTVQVAIAEATYLTNLIRDFFKLD